MGRFEETIAELKDHGDSVLVAYSGGKDSVIVADLCMRAFRRVEGFFLYLVPGLECAEKLLDEARIRWGLTIRQYPHFIVRSYIEAGVYCPNHYSLDNLPKWGMGEIYNLARADAGIDLIATGEKLSDSPQRRRRMKIMAKASGNSSRPNVIQPIKSWNKLDVLGYLRIRGLPLPASSGRRVTGIDLSGPEICYMHDTYPNDFAKIERVFPWIMAAVKRRDWYGVM
jgi:phosphoadenosine phosphosulfate reductase